MGAYNLLQSWYQDFLGRAPTLSKENLKSTRITYEKLFLEVILPGSLPFKFKYPGADVQDKVLTAEEIKWILFQIKSR